MSRFSIGSIVCPMWDKERRGKVTGYINEALVKVVWFPDAVNQECVESWHESNLMFVSPKEKTINTVKCKPIESTYPICTGGWKYVVINVAQEEAVAAFVEESEAEDYMESACNREDFMLREIDNS